jgi:rubrerythrin
MPGVISVGTATLANLMDAFNGESNAHARYLAFAAKADAEGWHGIASLFCAAAFAEHIHAGNHASVIKQQGGTPQADVHVAEVRSTLENLRVALGGEQFEIDTMYPKFISDAQAVYNEAAVRSFQWALEAEKSHARLFTAAIALLEAGDKDSRAAIERAYYVCPNCGLTSESPEEHDRCPVCKLSWKKFEIIR